MFGPAPNRRPTTCGSPPALLLGVAASLLLCGAPARAQNIVMQCNSNTTEGGGTAYVVLKLDGPKAPLGDLTLPFRIDNTAEAELPMDPTIKIPKDNWNQTFFIILKGLDDDVADPDAPVKVTMGPIRSTAGGSDPYAGKTAEVTTYNENDDVPSIVFSPNKLTTTDNGTSATAMITLGSKPSHSVTFSLTHPNAAEGKFKGTTTFTFTPADWDEGQEFEVEGVSDENVDDGDQSYTIGTTAAVSGDPQYTGITGTVPVTNSNTDFAGVVLEPTTCSLATAESSTGPAALFVNAKASLITFKLSSRPLHPVVFTITSKNEAEIKLNTSTVRFEGPDFGTVQAVQLIGQDDDRKDCDVLLEITISDAVSDDPKYGGQHGAPMVAINFDDDGDCLHMYPACFITYEDNEAPAQSTIWLSGNPTDVVTIPITSTRLDEAAPAVSEVKLGPSNWDTGVKFTVNGVDDFFADGDVSYYVQGGPAVSTDSTFSGLNTLRADGLNYGDDQAGIIVTTDPDDGQNQPPTRLRIRENAPDNSKNLLVRLQSQPYFPVTVTITLSDSKDPPTHTYTVSPLTLTFEPLKWNQSQKLVATAFNNYWDDDNSLVTLTLEPSSQDEKYNNKNASTTSEVTIEDEDTAGYNLVEVKGGQNDKFQIPVTEGADDGTVWNVTLKSQPLDDVILNVTGIDQVAQTIEMFHRELIVDPPTMTFTPSNWNVSQRLELKSNDDPYVDGTVLLLVTVSGNSSNDPKYDKPKVYEVWVESNDNDVPGMQMEISATEVKEGGNPAVVSVWLDTPPLCNYSFDLNHRVQGTGTKARVEGLGDDGTAASAPSTRFALSSENLVFGVFPDAIEWNKKHDFEVSAVDNRLSDGDVYVDVTVTVYDACFWLGAVVDSAYLGRNASVRVKIIDNDYPGLSVRTQTNPPKTTEAGGVSNVLVSLNTQPKGNVEVAVSSNNTKEGALSLSMLVFTPDNWDTPQTVIATGVDDGEIDGDQTFGVELVATSTDADYSGLKESLAVVNEDDDKAGVVFSEEPITSEDGTEAAVTLRLRAKPAPGQTVVLSQFVVVTDAGATSTEALVVNGSSTTLTFDESNWQTPQVVTVRGLDDSDKDGDKPYWVRYTKQSGDPNYAATPAAGTEADWYVQGKNEDNDIPGLGEFVHRDQLHQLTTSEDGATQTFSVVLRTQPQAGVRVAFAVNDTTEGALNVSFVDFTTTNWHTRQYVRVTGQDDDEFDHHVPYSVVFREFVTSDPDYGVLTPEPIRLVNLDNEVSPCRVYGGLCANANCTACCPSGCGECLASPCKATSSDTKCCADYIVEEDLKCTATKPAPCIVKVTDSVPCALYGGICKDMQCTVCCAAGCGECGGRTCNITGHPDKCCEKNIFEAEVDCAVSQKAPCLRLNHCKNVTCAASDECHTAGVCNPQTGLCTDPAKEDGTACSGGGKCSKGECVAETTCGAQTCTPSTYCKTIACSGSACGTETAANENKTCNDGNVLTGNDVCTGGKCAGVGKCGPNGVCSGGNCDVCCEKSCGNLCGAPDCIGECCVDAIIRTERKCTDDFSALPCVRTSHECLTQGGICNDAACSVCCLSSCGDKCGAADCASGAGGAAGCCKSNIDQSGKVCTAHTIAPCVRLTMCEEYGGVCEDATCEVCCHPSCGDCNAATCNANDMSTKCCASTIALGGNVCSSPNDAPCVRPLPVDQCNTYGGICADSSCTVCCEKQCGLKCGAPDCATAPGGADKCCPTKIVADKPGLCSKIPPLIVAPCQLLNPCTSHRGVCNDETCALCCANSCTACGGEEGCRLGPECCDKNIQETRTRCDGNVAPCVRVDRCTPFGGLCNDASCMTCCDPMCNTCNSDAATCDGSDASKCCVKSITQPCGVVQAPCLRNSKCSDHGGICKDEACTICFSSTCESIGAEACNAADLKVKQNCCEPLIAQTRTICGNGVVAPCTRVFKCMDFGGICKDEACEVCCKIGCGSCGGPKADPYDVVECPTEQDILDFSPLCTEAKTAPCIRNGKCKKFGGICEDEECKACCDDTCGQCGGESCHLEDENACCPEKIITGTAECSPHQHAPCVRQIHPCMAAGGLCNNEECSICCNKECKTCGGLACSLDPLGAENCCEKEIALVTGGKPSCTERQAPCVRTETKCPQGLCPDEACILCCHPGCGDSCGATTCASHPLGASNCCPATILKDKLPTGSAGVCNATQAGPCLRVTKCSEFGGICEDDDCAVCCDKGCQTCGGPDCASDPLGEAKCCPVQIGREAPLCQAASDAPPAGGEPSAPGTVTSPTAPCVRIGLCGGSNGICADEACGVCCPRTCGVCNGVACALSPGGEAQCCASGIVAAQKTCGPEAIAPCTRVSSAAGTEGSDDGIGAWVWVVLLLLVLCWVLAIAYIIYKRKQRKDKKEIERNRELFNLENKITDDDFALQLIGEDGEEKAAPKDRSEASNSNLSTPGALGSLTPSPAASPGGVQGAKKKGRAASVASQNSRDGDGGDLNVSRTSVAPGPLTAADSSKANASKSGPSAPAAAVTLAPPRNRARGASRRSQNNPLGAQGSSSSFGGLGGGGTGSGDGKGSDEEEKTKKKDSLLSVDDLI